MNKNKIFFPLLIIPIITCVNFIYFKFEWLIWIKIISLFLCLNMGGVGVGHLLNKINKEKEIGILGAPCFVLISGLVTWFCNVFLGLPSSLVLCLAVSIPMVIYLVEERGAHASFFKEKIRNLFIPESFGWLLFLFILFIGSLHLGIGTGEKPMDFGLLSYFYRHEGGQPTDIWAAGSDFSYYYLGYFIWGKWLKLFSLAPSVGYPLVLGLNAYLFYISCFGFFKVVAGKNRIQSSLMSLFVFIIPSFSNLYFVSMGKHWDFSHFWKATRIFKEGLFSEFPAWSYLFGDLHPHLMNFPFVVLFITFLFSFDFFQKLGAVQVLVAVFMAAALTMVNTWDGIYLFGFTFVFVLYSFLFGENVKSPYRAFFLNPIIYGLTGTIVILPWFKKMLMSPATSGGLSLNNGLSNGIFEYFQLYGVLWALFLSSFLLHFFNRLHNPSHNLWKKSLFFFLLLVPALVLSVREGGKESYFLSSSALLLSSLCLFYYFSRVKQNYLRLFGLLIFYGITLSLYFENVVLMDRINSLFKTNTFVFILLSLGITSLFFHALQNFLRKTKVVVVLSGVFIVFFISNTSLLSGISKLTSRGQAGFVTPLQHLKISRPGDTKIIEFLLNLEGNPKTVLEYYGAPYKYESSRMSTLSGNPSYLGWAGQHVTQRGLSFEMMNKRKKIIEEIYRTLDSERATLLLNQEKITYVIVGEYEKQMIPGPGLDKFDKFPDKYEKLVHHLPTGARLYKVK